MPPDHRDGEKIDREEASEWLEALDDVMERHGADGTRTLLATLEDVAARRGITAPYRANTPYVNTIPVDEQPPFPGNLELERRIKSLMRWNALAMVVRANREHPELGGHISTYASQATL